VTQDQAKWPMVMSQAGDLAARPMSRFTAQKTPSGFGYTEAHVGRLPLAVADPDDDPSNVDRHPRPGLLAYHSAGPSGDASSETGPRPEGPGRDPIIARVVLAGGRIGQSDRLIVELVDAGSTPVVILIRPQLSIARALHS
jgi:hypothetical protein